MLVSVCAVWRGCWQVGPFLQDEPVIRDRLGQVERTVIGHLHTPLIHWKSRMLAGMPVIKFLGTTPC